MQKLIYKNLYLLYLKTLSYGIAQILYVLLSTALVTFLLFNLTTSEFALYSLARVAPMLLLPLISLNLHAAIIRYYQEWKINKTTSSSLYTLLITQFLWLFISLPLIFVFAESLFQFLFTKVDYYPLIFIAIIAEILMIPSLYLRDLYNAKELSFKYATVLNVHFLIVLLFVILFVLNDQSAYSAIKGILFGNLLFGMISLFLLIKNTELVFNYGVAMKTIRFSIPTVPEISLNHVMMSIDRIFLDKFFDLKTIGIYSFARSLMQILNPLARTFKTAFIPYFYRTINSLSFNDEVKKSFYVYNLIILLFISIICLYVGDILFIFGNEDYYGSEKLIFLLGVYLYLDSIILINYFLIQSTSKTEYLLIGYILKLLFFLIPILIISWKNIDISIYIFTIIYIFSNIIYLFYLNTVKYLLRNVYYNFLLNIFYSILIFILIFVSIYNNFQFSGIYKFSIILFQVILLYIALTPIFRKLKDRLSQ